MYKNIIKIYISAFLIFTFILGLYFGVSYLDLFIFNLFFGVLYGIILFPFSINWEKSSLLFLCTIYSAFFIILINFISYQHNGNYFVFSEVDSMLYDKMAKEINYNLNWIPKVLSNYNFDDWGGIMMVSLAYLIGPSNLNLNLVYWIMGIISTAYLYKLSLFFLNRKYAYYCALAFSLSSFVLWFESSGLKETAIVFLVILSYYHIFKFQKNSKVINLILGLFTLFLLVFFRTVIPVFIGASFVLSNFIQQKNTFKKFFVIIITLLLTFSFSFIVENALDRYLLINQDRGFYEIKDISGAIKVNLTITYLVNILTSLFGPFPTFDAVGNPRLSIYSSGLLLKNLLSFSFIIGIYYIIKNKVYRLFPIILFPIIEIISLVIILEALELRKSIPHFPMVYIIIFWMIQKLNLKDYYLPKIRRRLMNYWFVYICAVLIMIAIWNYRFVVT